MNLRRIEECGNAFDNRLSRRAALRTAAVGAAGLAAIAAHRAAVAQDATPEASPVAAGEPVLYIQTFSEGTWTPISDDPEGFVITLTGVSESSIAIFDQSQGLVSTVPTEDSLEAIGVEPGEGATAALVAQTSDGERVVTVEIVDPFYDAAGGALIYTAHVADGEASDALSLLAERQTDEEFPESFEAGSLFIDISV